MKRCPQCGREYDLSMSFCLDDGAELLYGPAISEPPVSISDRFVDEPRTAILPDVSPDAAATRAQIHTTAAMPDERVGGRGQGHIFRHMKPLVGGSIILVLLTGAFFTYRYVTKGSSGQLNSVAVLPFANDTANVDLEYLSDGVAETLISSLSQIEQLSVKPRSSVFRFKGSDRDPRSVGKELAVDAVLTGRVAQRGEEMSFFVELVDIAVDRVIWSRQYSGKQADLLAIQRNIATDVSGRLRPALSEGDTARVSKTYTANPEAYQHYLRGNYQREKWTEDGYKRAIEEYNKAIEIDPQYGLAYAGLALAHLVSSDWFVPPNEAAPRIEAAAAKALELDPTLSEAHVALGLVALWVEWDWPKTEREIKRALELNPNNAKAYQLYGWYYSVLGQTGPAIEEARKAVAIEPLNLGMMGDLAWALIQAGKVDEGMLVLKQARANDDKDWWLALTASLGHERKGQMNEALAEINRARELNNSPTVLCYVGYMLAKAGKTAEARQIAKDLEEMSKTRFVSSYYRASIYAGLNDRDAAFALLEQADQQRSSLAGLGTEWIFENLRPDPRFNKLMDRLKLSHLKY